MQVGADHRNRALTIDVNLENVEYKRIPLKLKSLEVWGCGSSQLMDKQVEMKKQAVKDAENARKVKLNAVEWKDNPDRYLLDLAGSRPAYARFEKDTQNQTQ